MTQENQVVLSEESSARVQRLLNVIIGASMHVDKDPSELFPLYGFVDEDSICVVFQSRMEDDTIGPQMIVHELKDFPPLNSEESHVFMNAMMGVNISRCVFVNPNLWIYPEHLTTGTVNHVMKDEGTEFSLCLTWDEGEDTAFTETFMPITIADGNPKKDELIKFIEETNKRAFTALMNKRDNIKLYDMFQEIVTKIALAQNLDGQEVAYIIPNHGGNANNGESASVMKIVYTDGGSQYVPIPDGLAPLPMSAFQYTDTQLNLNDYHGSENLMEFQSMAYINIRGIKTINTKFCKNPTAVGVEEIVPDDGLVPHDVPFIKCFDMFIQDFKSLTGRFPSGISFQIDIAQKLFQRKHQANE